MRAALLALLLAAGAARAACDVDYRLEARWQDTPRHFAARVSFEAGGRTETRIAVSPDWGGVGDFHLALRGVEGAAAGVTVEADGKGWRVAHPPQGRVAVRYRVHGTVDADGGTLEARDFYRNLLGASHFHLFGYAMLPVPAHLEAVPSARGCLAFSALPAGASLATSLGDPEPGAAARFEAPLAHLTGGLFVGGDFRVVRREVAGRPLVFALRGDWKFDDARLADAATAVIRTHREFWGDPGFPRYLVTLIPNRLASGSIGGTSVHAAFAMHASRDFTVPGPGFDFLIGHEHLHAWVPGRIGGMPGGPAQAADYWFSEGFTNYLTHRLLLRAGVWTLDDYARALNEVIFELESSPVARERNERIRRDFWSDAAVHRLPYLRGELLALAFARLLERAGTSLEAVLRGMARAGAEDRATARFAAAAARHVPATAAMLEAYVERGDPVLLEVDTLGPCFEGRRMARAPFDLGFDRASFRTRIVAGVVADGPAARAGLRDGMALAGWSVRFGEPGSEVALQVREGEALRELRYLPRGEVVAVMGYAPREGARDLPACARWLAP